MNSRRYATGESKLEKVRNDRKQENVKHSVIEDIECSRLNDMVTFKKWVKTVIQKSIKLDTIKEKKRRGDLGRAGKKEFTRKLE